jgi:hypothetical protein
MGAQLDISGGFGFSWVLLVIAPLTALVTTMLLIALERGETAEATAAASASHEASAADSSVT